MNIEKQETDLNFVELRKEKWFDYLCSIRQGHTCNGGWVPNPKGGFYGMWFDWGDIGQIEISFKEGKTSQIKYCLKFIAAKKETTRENKPAIEELQANALKQGYHKSNRVGRTTTYVNKTSKIFQIL